MKKIALSFILLFVISFSGNAQVESHTIGVRVSGSNYGFGPEVSYQHGLGDDSRIEAGLGFSLDNGYNRFGLTGAYHLVFDIQSGFSWFVGPAAQVWIYSYAYHNNFLYNDNRGSVGGAVGAHFGVEYNFKELDLPFTAGIDSRPMFNFVNNNSGFEFALGISARYIF